MAIDGSALIKHRCPRCGRTLDTNGTLVWCTFVGDQRQGIKACTYGLDEDVTLDQVIRVGEYLKAISDESE